MRHQAAQRRQVLGQHHKAEGVMGIEPGRRDQHIAKRQAPITAGPGWRAAGAEPQRKQQERGRGQRRRQRIHARFLRVVDEEGIQRAGQRGANGGGAVKIDVAQPVQQRHQRDAGQRREAAQGELAVAGERVPDFQRQVVKRGMDIGRGRFKDGRHAAARQAAACRPSWKPPPPTSIPPVITWL